MKYNQLRILIREIITEIDADAKIKNPDTGRNIKISTALSYPKDTAAYKLAAQHKDTKSSKLSASTNNDKFLGKGSDVFTGPTTDAESFVGSARKQKRVNAFINKLSKQTAEAKTAGQAPPNFNLCEISIPGTNLFCQRELGIPRHDMPQLKGTPAPGSIADKLPKAPNGEVDSEAMFKKYLEKSGHKITPTTVDVTQLKASQTELVGAKVAGMRDALENLPPEKTKGITAPIFVSKDGYILDGHHRWAALVGVAMGKNSKNPPVMMDVQVIDIDAKEMIDITNKFTEKIGIKAKAASTSKGN